MNKKKGLGVGCEGKEMMRLRDDGERRGRAEAYP